MKYRFLTTIFTLSSLVAFSSCDSSDIANSTPETPNTSTTPGATVKVDIYEVDKESIEIGYEGGEVTFTTTTNCNFAISTSADWIEILSDGRAVQQAEEYIATLNVEPNETEEVRSGEVIIKFSDITDRDDVEVVVSINQAAMPLPMLTNEKICGVWTADTNGESIYYFYPNNKVYVKNGDRIDVYSWNYDTQDTTLSINGESNRVIYSDGTISLESGVVLLYMNETLPDEGSFYENYDDIHVSIGNNNFITWIPQEIDMSYKELKISLTFSKRDYKDVILDLTQYNLEEFFELNGTLLEAVECRELVFVPIYYSTYYSEYLEIESGAPEGYLYGGTYRNNTYPDSYNVACSVGTNDFVTLTCWADVTAFSGSNNQMACRIRRTNAESGNEKMVDFFLKIKITTK